uniref:DUF4240 domain-containing protein n=1 Tax=Sphingomonas bacterium TaxID=1895847 RepID=UPI002639E522|nr:DUF4240 domain-containing protein [Sphingomonas bacterium]
MTEARFWAIVAESTPYEADTDKQAAVLRASLEKLTPAELEGYDRVFAGLMKASYSWDLWGAAFVANGGASDDGFEYFRCWLISKGETAFRKVSTDPDSLATILAPDSEGDLEFEEFAYIARDVWAKTTGRGAGEMPGAANMIYGQKPSGIPFTEDSAALKKRYPKLWARFVQTD